MGMLKTHNPTNKVLVIYSKKQSEMAYKNKIFVAKGLALLGSGENGHTRSRKETAI